MNEYNPYPNIPNSEVNRNFATYSNPELAHVVGWAEHDDVDGAQEALKTLDFDNATRHIAAAEAAGNKAAREYFNEQRAALDALSAQFKGSETETSLERLASEVKQALAEQYNVSPEDFSLVTYEKDGETRNTVVCTRANGIDLGNPKRTMTMLGHGTGSWTLTRKTPIVIQSRSLLVV